MRRRMRESTQFLEPDNAAAWGECSPNRPLGHPSKPAFGWKDYAAAIAAAVAAFTVYVPMLPPTVTCEDSGELITAAYALGVAHPPGYPLWCLLAHLFTFVPHGTIAWRVALGSAAFGALTVFVLCLMVIHLCRNRWASFAAALAFAFSGAFWSQCLIPEVYSLNALQVALSVLLLLLWRESRRDAFLYTFALVYGSGLCNHHTMLLLGPVFVLFVILVEPRFWRRWPVYATCTLLALLVTLLYLYLPIRARANPAVNWGDPQTWQNFVDVVTRKQYSFSFVENPRGPAMFLKQVWEFFKIYAWEFTPWMAWLPFLGVFAVWRKNKPALVLLGLIAVLASLGLTLIINFKDDRQSLWVNSVFWIPAYLVGAAGIGLALDLLSGSGKGFTQRRLIAGALGFAAIVSPLAAHYRQNDKSNYYYTYDLGMNILKTLDQDAIYFPTADHATFPVLYLQAVEGTRPDIAIANKYGYPDESVYKEMPIETRCTFRKIPTKVEERIFEDWVIQHSGRPVYFTTRRSMEGLPGYRLANAGLTYRVLRPEESAPEKDYWAEYTWHTLDPEATGGELTADYVLSDYYFAQGRDLLAQGKPEDALKQFQVCLRLGGETKETLNNLGSACAEYGLMEQAEKYLTRTIELDPGYETALRNLGKVCIQLGRHDKALLQFEALVRENEHDAESVRLSAECMVKLGWFDDAATRYEFLLTITPDNADAFRELGYLYLDQKHDMAKAQRCLARSLQLNPNQPDLLARMSQAPDPQRDLSNPLEGLTPDPGLPKNAPPQMPALPQIPRPPRPGDALMPGF